MDDILNVHLPTGVGAHSRLEAVLIGLRDGVISAHSNHGGDEAEGPAFDESA